MQSVETELEPDCRGNNSYLLLYLYRHIQQPINENAKGKEITQFYAFCRICPSQCTLMQQVLETPQTTTSWAGCKYSQLHRKLNYSSNNCIEVLQKAPMPQTVVQFTNRQLVTTWPLCCCSCLSVKAAVLRTLITLSLNDNNFKQCSPVQLFMEVNISYRCHLKQAVNMFISSVPLGFIPQSFKCFVSHPQVVISGTAVFISFTSHLQRATG